MIQSLYIINTLNDWLQTLYNVYFIKHLNSLAFPGNIFGIEIMAFWCINFKQAFAAHTHIKKMSWSQKRPQIQIN